MANRRYRIVALGDSVIWGQGLQPEEKLVTRVQNWIKQFHPDFDVEQTLLAHSGAIIGVDSTFDGPARDGEVPTKFPTILKQVASSADAPGEVDLVLMNGGINDVSAFHLVNPLTDDEELHDSINRHCRIDLAKLLVAAGEKFTNAATRFVVTGYYPILSHDSNPLHMVPFLALFGVNLQAPAPFIIGNPFFKIAEQTLLFWRESTVAMKAAVAETNTGFGGAPRFFFVEPQFTPQNAAFASSPFVFGVNLDTSAQDSQIAHRLAVCPVQEPNPIQRESCFRASAGHPNVRGAERYFNDTFPVLQTFGL